MFFPTKYPILKNRILHLFCISILFLIACKKNNSSITTPLKTTAGKYIGIRNEHSEGNNPIAGFHFSDTAYTDTIDVVLVSDSIRFYRNSYYNQYLKNDSDYYSGYRSYYKIKDMDTLFDNSSFYSGTDALHYNSSSSSFIGTKN